MVDAFKGVIVIILLVLAFMVYPAYRQAEQVELNTKAIANAAVVEFVDTVRAKGYIDVRDYDVFLRSLDASYGVFDVQLEYYKKVLEPNYINPDDITTFQNSFNVRYDGYFTKEILTSLYPDAKLADDHPDRRFNMHVGDLFNVRIASRDTSLASRIRTWLFQSESAPISLKYGGMIRSEAP